MSVDKIDISRDMGRKLNLVENLEKLISRNPVNSSELKKELSELKKDIEDQVAGAWSVTPEEEKDYVKRFKKGEGLQRDDDCGYFERPDKYPIRVESFEKEDGSIEYDVDSVPFTGY